MVIAVQSTRPVSEVTAVSDSSADGHAKQHLGPAHKRIPTAPLIQAEWVDVPTMDPTQPSEMSASMTVLVSYPIF